MSDQTDGLSVVVPAYNEADGIGLVLQQIAQALAATNLPCEIIVVDDGSQDDTARVAQSHPNVRVFQHKGNRGYGAALKTGIRQACYELICITDADGTYPNNRIPELVTALQVGEHDMIVGARTGENVAIPLLRRPAKWVIARLARLVAGASIPDLNSGLRVFRRPAVLQFFNLLPDGFSFTTTITLGMLTNGYLVEYVAIDYYARIGKSKLRPIRDTLNFVQLVLRIALYFAPLKVFLPLSGLLALLAVGWGLFTASVFGKLADASSAVILMAAVQVAVLGLLAELINRRLPNYHRNEGRYDR